MRWDVAAGDPLDVDVVSRLDRAGGSSACRTVDPALLEPLPDRYVVVFAGPPDDGDMERLRAVARVRWLYLQLGLAEIDTEDESSVSALPAVAAVVPAWRTIGSTRGVVVGLSSLCAFAANQAGDLRAPYRHPDGIGYPVIADREAGKELDLDPTTALETPPALIPVINISLGTTSIGFPTSPNDAVNLATAAASGQVLLVVAAGNCGSSADDTLSAWARPDWTLSVGATDDEAGTRIASYSSRGHAGPDLVAYGSSSLDPDKKGTSFAAPRVTYLARLVVAALCQLGREVMVAQGHEPMGVPAVGCGIIDDFGDDIWWEPASSTAFQALPLTGVHPDVAGAMVAAVGATFAVRTTPAIVRELLLSSARPLPGPDTAAGGAGFVDVDGVIARLGAVTGHQLWGWFGTGEEPEPALLGQLRPFDVDGLRDLSSVVANTGPTVKFDYRTGRWAALPQPDASVRAEHPHGWQLDLDGIRL